MSISHIEADVSIFCGGCSRNREGGYGACSPSVNILMKCARLYPRSAASVESERSKSDSLCILSSTRRRRWRGKCGSVGVSPCGKRDTKRSRVVSSSKKNSALIESYTRPLVAPRISAYMSSRTTLSSVPCRGSSYPVRFELFHSKPGPR